MQDYELLCMARASLEAEEFAALEQALHALVFRAEHLSVFSRVQPEAAVR